MSIAICLVLTWQASLWIKEDTTIYNLKRNPLKLLDSMMNLESIQFIIITVNLILMIVGNRIKEAKVEVIQNVGGHFRMEDQGHLQ